MKLTYNNLHFIAFYLDEILKFFTLSKLLWLLNYFKQQSLIKRLYLKKNSLQFKGPSVIYSVHQKDINFKCDISVEYFVLNYQHMSSNLPFKVLMMTQPVLFMLLLRQSSWLFQWCQPFGTWLLPGFPGTSPSSGPYPDKLHKQQWALLPMGCSQAQLK